MSKETTDIKIEKLGMEAKPFDKVLAKVAELCPAAVQNGKVDFERLKAELADVVDENARETYEFKWVGKNAAMVEANKPIRKTLRPCKEESKNWDATENLYIEGDNLEVLKLLEEGYLGKIKMIYIDPPYNTGNDFVYHDNRVQSEEEMNQGIDLFDEEDNRLLSKSFVRNTESSGRFHSDWCSMMYPRLKLARDLLTDDGVIFISIDDNEVANLKKICDEVFGEDNGYGIITWTKKRKGSFLSKGIISLTEYVLVYTKCRGKTVGLYGGTADSSESQPIIKRTNKSSILSIPSNTIYTKLSDGMYKAGVYGDEINPVELLNDIRVKDGKIVDELKMKAPFVWSQQMLNEQLSQGAKFIINTLNFQIRVFRIYDEDNFKGFSSFINGISIKGTNEDAYEELERLFSIKNLFNYSKPVNYIKELVNSATHFNRDSIILDFFSGSATTAHAVMQLNAEDGGNRKFIMVQLPEETDEKSEAYKNGYKNICEIGKERIRRAGDKIMQETGKTDLDIGFRVLKVDDSNMQDVYYKPSELKQADLLSSIDNIKADRTPLDLLFGVMVEWGVSLSLPLQEVKVGENTIHIVGDNDLVACFDRNVSTATITKMAELNPTRVVFRDSCFEKDDEKINMFEIFKTICHWDDKRAKDNVRVM